MIKRWKKRIVSFALLLSTVTISFSNTFNTVYANEAAVPVSEASTNSLWPEAPEISAGNAILIDADTGAILYEKAAYDKCYPASTTKILTGLLTVENCNMDETVTFSSEAANSVTWEDANLATKAGEQYSVQDALYALLLYSANEVAYGLAEHVGGNITGFVEMMNARAKELGAVNTHFSNASGLYSPNHYTTAYDMAMIAKGCYNNTTFVNIDSTATSYTIAPTNVTPESRTIKHRHLMLKDRAMYYEYCKGGKTGFTDQSGYTLVTFAEKNDMRLICVCFNCSNSNVRFTDTRSLFDWGFDNFKKVTTSGDTLSSAFSDSSYYQSDIFGSYKHRFNLSASTLTIPNDANVSDISLVVDDNHTSYEANNVYTTNIEFKYGDNTVATSLLTFSEDAPITDSRLPYLSRADSSQDKSARRMISVNIWVIVAIASAIFIIIYIIQEAARAKRKRRMRHYRR